MEAAQENSHTALRAPETSLSALLRLSAPILIGNAAVIGFGVIDAMMAGRQSTSDLAALALGASIYATVLIILVDVVQGLSPIAGHHYGAQRWKEIGNGLQQGLWLSLWLSAIGVPLLLATTPWMDFARPPADVADLASKYLQVVSLGLPAMLAARVFVAVNAAVSRPRVAMGVNLFALALKVPLNWIFMYGWGPIEGSGAVGAGISTAVLSWVILGLNLAIWRLDRFYERFRSERWHGPQLQRQRELLRLGIPLGLSMMFENSAFTFMAILVARLGAEASAGHIIIANIVALLFMVPLALGIGTSVLIAQSLGAGHPKIARSVAWRGFRLAALVVTSTALLIWFVQDTLLGFFTSDARTFELASSLIFLALVFNLFDSAQGVAGFILRGYKVTFWPMLVYGTALTFIGLGGGYWIAFHESLLGPPRGVRGFWEAAAVGVALAAAALLWLAERVSSNRNSGRTIEANAAS